MDVRVKTFAAEAEHPFVFLVSELGFLGPEIDNPRYDYPVCLSLRYHRSDMMVDVSLVLAYGGEEYVETRLIVDRNTDHERLTQVGLNSAHTGYQMRRSLDRQAAALQQALRAGR